MCVRESNGCQECECTDSWVECSQVKSYKSSGFLLAALTSSLLPFVITGVHQAFIAFASPSIPQNALIKNQQRALYLSVAWEHAGLCFDDSWGEEIEHEEKKEEGQGTKRGRGRCNYRVETCLRACKFKIMTEQESVAGNPSRRKSQKPRRADRFPQKASREHNYRATVESSSPIIQQKMIKSSSRGISLQKFKHVLNLSRNYTFGLCVASAFFQLNSEREQGWKERKKEGKKEQPKKQGYLISRYPRFNRR